MSLLREGWAQWMRSGYSVANRAVEHTTHCEFTGLNDMLVEAPGYQYRL